MAALVKALIGWPPEPVSRLPGKGATMTNSKMPLTQVSMVSRLNQMWVLVSPSGSSFNFSTSSEPA